MNVLYIALSFFITQFYLQLVCRVTLPLTLTPQIKSLPNFTKNVSFKSKVDTFHTFFHMLINFLERTLQNRKIIILPREIINKTTAKVGYFSPISQNLK